MFAATVSIALAAALASLPTTTSAAVVCAPEEYELYVLAGQSNMDGYGKVADLPAELKPPMDGAWIFHGNPEVDGADREGDGGRGLWKPLQPGHGRGFRSTAEQAFPSDAFGVELSFVQRLKRERPGARIALLKYSRGGTSIDQRAAGNFGCWDPDFEGGTGAGKGVNQYDHFLATLRHATAQRDIDGDGEVDTLRPRGILWMQGESDAAYTEAIAGAYQANLQRLMELMRAALHRDDVPVVIGRISDSGRGEGGLTWTHGEVVRAAQAAFVASDRAGHLVTSTDEYGYSDPWHYDSAGYLDLGARFAEALLPGPKKGE